MFIHECLRHWAKAKQRRFERVPSKKKHVSYALPLLPRLSDTEVYDLFILAVTGPGTSFLVHDLAERVDSFLAGMWLVTQSRCNVSISLATGSVLHATPEQQYQVSTELVVLGHETPAHPAFLLI